MLQSASHIRSTSLSLVFLIMPSSFSFGFEDDDVDQDTLGGKVPEDKAHADEKEDSLSMPPKLHSCLDLVGSNISNPDRSNHFHCNALAVFITQLASSLASFPQTLILRYAVLLSAKSKPIYDRSSASRNPCSLDSAVPF